MIKQFSLIIFAFIYTACTPLGKNTLVIEREQEQNKVEWINFYYSNENNLTSVTQCVFKNLDVLIQSFVFISDGDIHVLINDSGDKDSLTIDLLNKEKKNIQIECSSNEKPLCLSNTILSSFGFIIRISDKVMFIPDCGDFECPDHWINRVDSCGR